MKKISVLIIIVIIFISMVPFHVNEALATGEVSSDKIYMYGTNLKDKNIAFIGDSLTSVGYDAFVKDPMGINPSNTYKYIDYVRDYTGAKCYNFGVASSTVSTTSDKINVPSFPKRVDDIVTKYPNQNQFDIIVIFGGVNDYGQSVKIGDLNSDKSTFIGGLKYIVETLQSHYPSAKIVLMTPTVSRNTDVPFDLKPNGAGSILQAYRDTIHYIANIDGVNVFDTNQYSGLNPNNKVMFSKYFGVLNAKDGVHPNPEGQKKIAVPLINYLNNLYLN